MVDHKKIYQQEGDLYQRLIAREDYRANLLPAIREISSKDGLDVVDLGSGTGRLACALAPQARMVYAFDVSAHMLGVAHGLLEDLIPGRWLAAAADHRAIPLPADSADLVLSGWSFCYLAVWEENDWQSALDAGLSEIKRVLREEGSVIIIETLGTGVEEPDPPGKLVPYLSYLEDRGFSRTWTRTDYRFCSQQEARELTGFFFGEEMLAKLTRDQEPILPECTGIWWRQAIDL